MKLLLTNDELHEIRGGTQTFTMDLALGLRARGHEVAIYAWMRGSLADELAGAGVPVIASPRECGFLPEVIHAQHHLAAMTAILPALFPIDSSTRSLRGATKRRSSGAFASIGQLARIMCAFTRCIPIRKS